MAEGAVGFLLQKVDTLLLKERKLLSGIRSEVEDIKDELESIRAFLKDADSREEDDLGVKTWVKQVREVAYDTEDAIDEFVLLSAKQPHTYNLFIRSLCKTLYFIKYWKGRHSIAIQIQSIKNRFRSIYERSQRYRFNRLDRQESNSNYKPDPRGNDALLVSESELVGISRRRDEMLRLLLEGDPKLKVVSVFGMAGLGKTTLVKKLYDFPGLKEFFQCHSWIIISQSFQIEQILRDMVKQLFGEIKQPTPEGVEKMDRIGLNEVLKEFLQQKRYVIVFDDIWSTDAWDALKYALPDCNNCSRIMITTRIADVASYSSRSIKNIYELKPLNQDESWDLFCMKTFPSNHTCPSRFKAFSENILNKCGGLPLAIVVIASLLSTKEEIQEWETVLYNLHTQIESDAKLHNMMKIIMLSYNDLPYYLKSCFLYLSSFPEDYQFKRTKLVRLWVAEGFVEDKHGSKVEDVAESYFKELVNRSFIQMVPDNFQVWKVKWQVHDLIHEMILQKFHDQNFGTVIAEDKSMRKVSPKIRRLYIHNSNERLLISWNESKSFSHLRSLLLFDISSSVPTFLWDCLKLLNVLDLEGAPLDAFPEQIGKLIHLRFLSLKETKIKKIPPSIGMLSNLETLDLKHTSVSKLPAEILNLRRLRHLLAYHGPDWLSGYTLTCMKGSTVPNGIGNLEFLQTLTSIEVNLGTNIVNELGRLTQLKRLGITKLRREDGIHLCASLEKMKNLRHLHINAAQEEEIIDLESFTSPPPLLRRLQIVGPVNNFWHWIPSLYNLERVVFGWSRFTTDPLEALQALPRLQTLHLLDAYDGEELRVQAGGFRRLLAFSIFKFKKLRLVRVEEGAMPLVQRIVIDECAMLERVPIGIEGLNNLKKLIVLRMPPEFAEMLHQDYQRVSHIPTVQFGWWKGGKYEFQYL
ncbi:hypothetical protein NE237_005376 [Protea cynaroides]|uniref:Uncharacterized protein n=1 Tax=Protea cynaroides TaxID=273540 RepID=A0A9Q0KKH8_9MAGN|nr:hypothetical protein NE237_005376 [Protea cynaroides]